MSKGGSMNQVPFLRSGVGSNPADGGCIMQVIDWIASTGWTDHPKCVHPVFQKLAIHVNDQLDDRGRQQLLDLAPRLMGTASDDKALSVRLATFCARRVLDIYERKYPDDLRPREAVEAAERWVDNPSKENAAHAAANAANAAANAASAAHAAHAAANAAANAAHAAANAWRLLVDTLDEYDRLTGRTVTGRIDWCPVAEMLELART